MAYEKRLALIKSVGEEIITEDELIALLDEKKKFTAYDGFEPSGNVHIAQAILRAINVNKMIAAGCEFKMLVADWHGWANNKLGGILENIQITGKYLIEVWRKVGMDLNHVEFLWSSDFAKDDNYWKKVMQIARNSTLKRILRTAQIMGRTQKDSLQASQILYPCMQCADIFHMDVDVTQLGMDQRKVNVLAREVGPKLFNKKPVVISHHMLMGLHAPKTEYDTVEERVLDLKMSKTDPDSAIFITDTKNQIKRKINKAHSPDGTVTENPILEYVRYIIFEKFNEIKIERPIKYGGDVQFSTYEDLEKAFSKGELKSSDLKPAVAKYLNELVEPIRKSFETDSQLKELRDQVMSFVVTR